MPVLTLVVRSLAMIAHAVWLGGFTFYSAVVLWVVHEAYGSLEAGRITQRVTDWLNAIGVATVALWWLVVWIDRRLAPTFARRLVVGLLALTTLLLAFLLVDHRFLDHRLEHQGLSGFYAPHRVYLIASTAQWAVNLLLIPATLRLWHGLAAGTGRQDRVVG
jgi:hypothetical protein